MVRQQRIFIFASGRKQIDELNVSNIVDEERLSIKLTKLEFGFQFSSIKQREHCVSISHPASIQHRKKLAKSFSRIIFII